MNKKHVSTLSNGGYFGELALIYGTPRSATCVAKNGSVETFRLDRTHYRMLLMVRQLRLMIRAGQLHRAFQGNLLRKRKMYEDFLKKIEFLS